MKAIITDGLTFLGGMLIATVPFIIYFGFHGAIWDWLGGYIYNNVFLYTDEARTLMDVARDIWTMIRSNLLWVMLAGVGKLAFLLDRRESLQLKLCVMAGIL